MGVGPEQNFTYIAALKPAMVFIVDIRRGNLDLQLMYKALFEMSADRAEFVSRLFSRKRPEGLDRRLDRARRSSRPSRTSRRARRCTSENLKAIDDLLRDQAPLSRCRTAICRASSTSTTRSSTSGPALNYSSTGGFGGRRLPADLRRSDGGDRRRRRSRAAIWPTRRTSRSEGARNEEPAGAGRRQLRRARRRFAPSAST